MNRIRRAAVRAVLPVTVFVAVAAFHFVWLGLFPEKVATEASCGDDCAACEGEAPPAAGWLDRYVAGQNYWLGYSYAASLTFAVAALRRYREQRSCTARNVALGGVTASGLLAVFGCYLLGCCGSPMLPIYLSLFGAAFLPLAPGRGAHHAVADGGLVVAAAPGTSRRTNACGVCGSARARAVRSERVLLSSSR